MKKVEMIGKKFGLLEVVNNGGKDDKGHLMYECLCECGNIKKIHGTHLRSGRTVSCGCKNKLKTIGSDYWYRIIHGGVKRRISRSKLEINITKDYVYNLFLEQKGLCKLSGLPITLPKSWRDREHSASLDRIDSTKGYVVGNVQWVHKMVNVMKNTFPQDMFLYVCSKICENNKIVTVQIEEIDKFKWGLNNSHKVN